MAARVLSKRSTKACWIPSISLLLWRPNLLYNQFVNKYKGVSTILLLISIICSQVGIKSN